MHKLLPTNLISTYTSMPNLSASQQAKNTEIAFGSGYHDDLLYPGIYLRCTKAWCFNLPTQWGKIVFIYLTSHVSVFEHYCLVLYMHHQHTAVDIDQYNVESYTREGFDGQTYTVKACQTYSQ